MEQEGIQEMGEGSVKNLKTELLLSSGVEASASKFCMLTDLLVKQVSKTVKTDEIGKYT